MSKILCIVRASTEHQEIESQKKELIDFVRTKGYNDSDMVFIEAQGASARSLNKKYIKMLEDIKNSILYDSEIKAVALWALNRLGRVESKLHEMKEFFVNNKIQVYCKDPSFCLLKDDGTEDTAGGMMFSVYAAMVKLDTEEMFAKMKRGKKRNAAIGKANNNITNQLFGYRVDENGYVVPNIEEAKDVNEIYDIYNSGKYSFSSLARELNERGFKQRGKKVTIDWVGKILSSTAYIGYSDKGIHYRKYIPIISQEKFDKAKSIRTNNSIGAGKGRTKEYKHTNLGTRLIKCPICGGNYIASSGKYVCYRHRNHQGCDNKNQIKMEVLDELIWEVAQLLHIDFMQQPNNNLAESLKNDIVILKRKVDGSKQQLNDIESKKAKVADIYVDGIITKKQYHDRLGRIEADNKQAKADISRYMTEIDKLERQIDAALNPSFDTLLIYADNLSSMEIKKMKNIVNQHIKSVWFDDEVVNGIAAKHIHIVDESGIDWEYIYFFRQHSKDGATKVYSVKGDKLVPHGRTSDKELMGKIVTYMMYEDGVYDELLNK